MMVWTAVLAYMAFVVWRLGIHKRLPLIVSRISLETIPDRAARSHGDMPLFTTDEPCAWNVPAFASRYSDPNSWSATRILDTAGFVAAALLKSCELHRGDRVALFKTNHLDMHVLMSGIVRAGGIACPINSKFAADKLHPYLVNIGAQILISDTPTLLRAVSSGADLSSVTRIIIAEHKTAIDDAGTKALNATQAVAPRAELIWIEDILASVTSPAKVVERRYSDVMYLVHSSGTTGFPKAVTLRNGPQSHAVRGWLSYVHLSPSRDKGFLAVPNNHQAVILSFNSLLLLGLKTHWTGAYDRDGFVAERVVRQLESGAFTGFFGFPVTYTMLKEIPREVAPLRRMRFWATTADASHEAIQKRFISRGGAFRSIGIPIDGSIFMDAQGSSEVGTPSVLRYVTRFTRRFERRIGRRGSTPFGPQLRISYPSGHPVPRGAVGRLEVKGKTVFDSYWNDPDLTSLAFCDGWFFTGDVARLDRDGNFIQLDREVDVIHTGDGDVYTLLIEEIVHKHPSVFDACVYAARQSNGTQLPAAWIAPRHGHDDDADNMMSDLNGMLPTGSKLSHVEVHAWEDFPMGVTGKTLKRVLSQASEPALPTERNRPPGFRGSALRDNHVSAPAPAAAFPAYLAGVRIP
jgi:long-chain acyl-CoA synthetase